MICKHNVMNIYGVVHQCAHCGYVSILNTEEIEICKQKYTPRCNVNIINGMDAQKQNPTADNINTVCQKHALILNIDEDTKQYDAEIHIQGKDIFEILEGLEIIREQIHRDNGLVWSEYQ